MLTSELQNWGGAWVGGKIGNAALAIGAVVAFHVFNISATLDNFLLLD